VTLRELSRRTRAGLATLAAIAAILAPSVVAACPACAGRTNGGGLAVAALGGMILFPFGVAVVVYRVIRKSGTETEPPWE
jgi:hypothetical protein